MPGLATKLPSTAPAVSAPAPVPLPFPSPAAPAAAAVATFELSAAEVAEHWANQGKTDLRSLEGSTFHIPVPVLDQALKTGRLRFEWRDVRPWLTMPAGSALPAFSDDYAIELPLAIVAPKFLKLHGPVKARKKVEVSDEIPDLFAQKSASQPAPPAALEPSAPAPSAHSAPGVAAKPLLDYGDIFGQPDKKSWTLAEVTQRAAALRGVAGALIATSDGLLVAGAWPAGVQNEAVAAFIPQMHSRMVQCTKELKLGEPGNFTLIIENVPLQIFKTGGNYLAVLGKAGENLPKPQLTALAMRLSQTQL
jgi:predicted regulator of Ras-like GTPase activity (Roadblock/LC7/MglB family)